MSEFLRLRGESRGEYFHIDCADCGRTVHLTDLRWVGGVPQVVAHCPTCDLSWDFTLPVGQWAEVLSEQLSGAINSPRRTVA